MAGMVDVSDKKESRRRALASGSLRMGQEAFTLLRDGKLPKGDALKIGEIAGILAAKRTPETIPLCHPLPLDKVALHFELDASLPGVRAFCEAYATAKTGVEMEALSGVSGALIAIYDLVKQVDPALTISDIRLEVKEGGKSGLWRHPDRQNSPHPDLPPQGGKGMMGKAVVVTVSDRCSKGEAEDRSGPILAEGLRELGLDVSLRLVPDERERIENTLRCSREEADLIVLTGGTGLSPRDVTPEAVEAVCERMIPGVGEALRAAGGASTPLAPLSRSVAGQLGRCLIVALPGSEGGARDGLKVLKALLPHALHVIAGGNHG